MLTGLKSVPGLEGTLSGEIWDQGDAGAHRYTTLYRESDAAQHVRCYDNACMLFPQVTSECIRIEALNERMRC